MLGSLAGAPPVGHATLPALRVRVQPTRRQQEAGGAVRAAKLPYGQGDLSPRKPSLQTQATSPAVSAAAIAPEALGALDSREELEKLYGLGGDVDPSLVAADNSMQALEDVEALLADLQGLDLELDAALEVALEEDFSELTVSTGSKSAPRIAALRPRGATPPRAGPARPLIPRAHCPRPLPPCPRPPPARRKRTRSG
jgi:hypothetical protein